MYLIISLFFPLLNSIMVLVLERLVGRTVALYASISVMFLTSVIYIYIFYLVSFCTGPIYFVLSEWICCENFIANWGFLLDSLAVVMLFVVISVSFLVHLYSIDYMYYDHSIVRFMSYLSLFTFFMVMLVSADNFLQLFFGWEGVGLCSYLLINFWYTRVQANKAALKAMIVNRVGDFGLALGIAAIYYIFSSIEFSVVFYLVPYFLEKTFTFLTYSFDILTVISLLLFVGAVGKSAQIGLHTWLPDAMEGPTPVSALIHAATMVTAGVFLLIRCSPLFEYAPTTLVFITFIGSLTAFFASTIGIVQNDLKKVIAYSTCSQLGYMVFACGLSNYNLALFHLANHAFFKALLFLCAGSVIHALANEQDMRKMGGLFNLLPITYNAMLIASLSLMGFPYLTGFYSKEVILEVAYASYNLQGTVAYWLGLVSALFTAFYSFRLIYLAFLTKPNGFKRVIFNAHESSLFIIIPLVLLTFGSIFIGYLGKDMFIGLGTNYFKKSIFILSENYLMIDSEFIPHLIKLLPLFFTIIGAGSALLLNIFYSELLFKFKLTGFGQSIYKFFSKKWYIDKVYNSFIGLPILNAAYEVYFKTIDKVFIENYIGPNRLSGLVYRTSFFIRRHHTGYIYKFTCNFLLVTFIIFLFTLKFYYFY